MRNRMFDKKIALNYILEIACKKGFTQAELVKDLYDYSHFNRMCNGKENIHEDVLFKCANRLGISTEELIQKGNSSKLDIKCNRDKFEKLLQEQKYDEIRLMYENLKIFESENVIERQFMMRLHACVELECQQNMENAIKILYNALELTQKMDKGKQMSCNALSGSEQGILNDIAICEYRLGNVEKAITILKQLSEIDVKTTDKSIDRSKVKILYNLSLYFMRLQNIEEGLIYTERGIHVCVHTMTYSYLFPLYYNLAILNHLQDNQEEFKRILDISYTLAFTQNKGNIFLSALKEDIKQFNVSKEIYEKYKNMANTLITN